MYLPRNIDKELNAWRKAVEGKPLLIRGARQVGKCKQIIPIEVKSGKKGSMQSLYLFMEEKKSKIGVRFSLENYAAYNNISVYPLYAVSDFIKNQ
jgi:predicted AAA+ superfamily ATPase